VIDTVAEFRERRAETWRRVRYSLAIMALGFGYLFFVCVRSGAMSSLCMVAFGVVVAAIGHATLTWIRFYRCPACEEPVRDDDGGVPLNPKACRNCGAKLR
jgi:hypothetical protein